MEEPSVCEEQVYNGIYHQYANELRNRLYYKYGNLSRAEDVVQEGFIKLWDRCSEVVYQKVGAFLYTLCNNLAIDKIRAEKVALNFQKGLMIDRDLEDPYFRLRTKEFQTKLESAISALPEKQREAFLLNRIDKLTYKEIAERLGVSQTAIENRISKALKKLSSLEEIKNFSL